MESFKAAIKSKKVWIPLAVFVVLLVATVTAIVLNVLFRGLDGTGRTGQAETSLETLEAQAYSKLSDGDYQAAATLFLEAQELATSDNQPQAKIDELQQQHEYAVYQRDNPFLPGSGAGDEVTDISSETMDGATYYTTNPQQE